MFKLSNALAFDVTHRLFGHQDRGISPKGASDQTSFLMAHALLGRPQDFRCTEIIAAKEITFNEKCIFTLTGAHYRHLLLNNSSIEKSRVYEAKQGDILKINTLLKGFRLYLMASVYEPQKVDKTARAYGDYFPEPPPYLRLLKGPEFDYLKEDITTKTFHLSAQSDLSGLRLQESLEATQYDIITSAVTDGTMQLTQSGPIILMRHRQSTGGYPRIATVIEADLDRLAQYPFNTSLQFQFVDLPTAQKALLQYEKNVHTMQEDLL